MQQARAEPGQTTSAHVLPNPWDMPLVKAQVTVPTSLQVPSGMQQASGRLKQVPSPQLDPVLRQQASPRGGSLARAAATAMRQPAKAILLRILPIVPISHP